MDLVWLIVATLVGGIVLGVLGKLVAPGHRDNIPFWLTVVCGIIGMLVGSYLYWAILGSDNGSFDGHEPNPENATNGIDWVRHAWQVAVAALAVMVAALVTGRGKASARV